MYYQHFPTPENHQKRCYVTSSSLYSLNYLGLHVSPSLFVNPSVYLVKPARSNCFRPPNLLLSHQASFESKPALKCMNTKTEPPFNNPCKTHGAYTRELTHIHIGALLGQGFEPRIFFIRCKHSKHWTILLPLTSLHYCYYCYNDDSYYIITCLSWSYSVRFQTLFYMRFV